MVAKNSEKYPDTKAYNYIVNEFNKKGVSLEDIAQIVVDVQKRFLPDLELHEALKALTDILHKREIMNIIMPGLAIDSLATKKLLPEPLQTIVEEDMSVYGNDEDAGIDIAHSLGSIAVTNYGKLDVDKTGIIKKLDNKKGVVNTYIDDIVGALAAATMSKVAHQRA